MTNTFRRRLVRISAAICPIFLTTPAALAASTALWIGNPGVTATTNWSDNANWSNGAPGYNNNDAVFGGTGSALDNVTINSVADVTAQVNSLTFTNGPGQFHNVFIPAGTILTNANALSVGNKTADAYATAVTMSGGGTLLKNGGAFSVINFGSAASTALATLDLSGLSNFVYNDSAGTMNIANATTGNRFGGLFVLAALSNNITVNTINFLQNNASNAGNGNNSGIRFGTGTNVINVGTFNVVGGKNSGTVQFAGGTGGLRVRGVTGASDDNSRANVTVAVRTSTGTGTTTGNLNLNGHPVDIKTGTLTIGQDSQGGGNAASGTVQFDMGTIDATNILMGIAGNAAVLGASGTITVGANGKLIIGANGMSMVNQSAGAGAAGTLNINGGIAQTFGNIRKTTTAGTATINVSAGSLLVSAVTNTVGTTLAPIDTLNLTDSTLSLAVSAGGATVVAGALNALGSTDTINVTSVPGIAIFPAQFPVISYSSFNANYDFVLGSLPGTYQGYLSNNVSGLSIDLVITNSQVKTDIWRGNVNGNWDLATLNWFSGGAVSYQEGDLVTFDDTLTGTPNVNLTTALSPAAIGVNNSSANYIFSGVGKLSGTTSLSKAGASTLTLSETGGDDFTGGIALNGGMLILDNANSAIAGGLNITSGAVQIGNNDANGALPSGSITDDGILIFNTTANLTIGTPITGAGAVVQKSSGKITLSAANTYAGSTVVSNGTLALTGASTVSSSSQLNIANAAFDLSGLNQQTLVNALNVTNATITVPVVSGVTNISATSIASGGAGNVINVSAFPPIASYPVTFVVVQSAAPIGGNFNFSAGTLPAANPPYVANVTQSIDQTAVLLTVTAGPVGTRPSVVWSGADVPNLNTNWSDRLNWQLPGAPTAGDNVIFNNTATVSASAISSPGGGSSALVFDNVNNIVDNNFTVNTLTYTNTADSYHNTFIKSGNTLSTTNLTIGAFDSGAAGVQHEFVTVSGGVNSSLSVSNTASNFQVWVGNASSACQATLDMSALDNFNATVNRLTVGASAINNAVNRPSGILYLAKTNSIKAGFQTTTVELGTTTGNAGIVLGDCNQNAGPASFIYLGQVNAIYADTIAIARQKTVGTVLFNPIYASVAPYPTVTFQGFSSSQVSVFNVGDGVGNTGTTTGTGNLNLSGGIVKATVDTMNIGRASLPASGTSGGTMTGNLLFDAGTISVNTMNLGWQPSATTKVGIGTINVGSNAVIGVSATLVLRGSLNLAFAANGNSTGTINITNGVVRANNIVPGTNSNPTIGIYGGQLVVTNAIGNSNAELGALLLSPLGTSDNSRNTLNVPVGYGIPGIMVTNLSIDALDTTTNVINIESVGPAAAVGVELPIIQYQTLNFLAGATFNIGLGTLPAGYTGVLTNDTATSTIGLVLASMIHPQPRMNSFVQSGNTLTISGINGFANGPFHVLASTDVTAPLSSWTSVGSGVFGPTGDFSFNATIDPAKPQQFFIVQVP